MQVERDAGTRMAYLTLATWALFLYFVGPVTPLVGQQLGLSDRVAGLIGVALAAGLVLAGLGGTPVVLRVGRRRAGVGAALALAVGCLAMAAAPAFSLLLAAVLVSAAAGSLLMNVATAALADRHGAAGPRAITEANAVAAWVGLTAPLLLGAVVAVGWGWRAAAVVIAVVAVTVAAVLLRVPLAEAPARDARLADPATQGAPPRRPLPPAFFAGLLAVVAAVGAEISLNFWGAVLIAGNTGEPLAATTAGLSVLIGGIAMGRTFGSALTRRWPVPGLILASLAVTAAGFLVVWTASTLAVALIGLAVTGLGLALLFPLTASLTLAHAAGQSDRAMALIAITIGIAMGAAPFVLGALAGAVGVGAAFAVVPVLLVLGAVAVGLTQRFGAADAGRSSGSPREASTR